MSIFCRFSEEDLKWFKECEEKFHEGVKTLSSEDKVRMTMHLFKLRHNLMVDLIETRNKNTVLTLITVGCVILTIFCNYN